MVRAPQWTGLLGRGLWAQHRARKTESLRDSCSGHSFCLAEHFKQDQKGYCALCLLFWSFPPLISWPERLLQHCMKATWSRKRKGENDLEFLPGKLPEHACPSILSFGSALQASTLNTHRILLLAVLPCIPPVTSI